MAVLSPTIDVTGDRLLDEIGETTDLTLVRGPIAERDHAIDRARHALSQRIYREIGLEDLASARGHTALLATGEWRRERDPLLPHVLAVAELRFQRVIVLPTRFDTSEDEIREALARTRATVFAADESTYARIVSLCDARLAEDHAPPHNGASGLTRAPAAGVTHADNRAGTERVTAVILTRDRPDAAARAIGSIRAGTHPAHILVIDNNSSAAAAAELSRSVSSHDAVSLWRTDRNLGCAGGRRLGAELSDTELVLLLDDDAELEPDALELLVAELDANPASLAVTATVSTPDGLVQHSGGWVGVDDGVADFIVLGAGRHPSDENLPAVRATGWVPGTAVLVRRAALDEFPIDAGMAGYYEDNEWCYRVGLARPDAFRRSPDARATHHLSTEHVPGRDFATRAKAVRLLDPLARFYERHGQLLAPSVFHLVPELRDADGRCDAAAARLLMELLLAKGQDWVLAEWMNGGLAGLLEAGTRQADAERALAAARSENQDLRAQLAEREAHVAAQAEELNARASVDADVVRYLQDRHETLARVESGGWWRLRQRLLPALRLLWRIRGRDED